MRPFTSLFLPQNKPCIVPLIHVALVRTHECIRPVVRFATEKLRLWQRRLNLRDWDVSVIVSRSSELKPKTLGNLRWDRSTKTAVIRVLDPADYRPPFAPMPQDVEFTVLHELIRLEIAPALADLPRTDANRVEEEHAVNHLADALLLLDCRGN